MMSSLHLLPSNVSLQWFSKLKKGFREWIFYYCGKIFSDVLTSNLGALASGIINLHQHGLQKTEPHLLLSYDIWNKSLPFSDNHTETGNTFNSLWKSLSHVWLFATPWTIQSSGILAWSRILDTEYWIQNTGVGRLSLLQGIFAIQVSCITGGFFTSWATREAQEYWSG